MGPSACARHNSECPEVQVNIWMLCWFIALIILFISFIMLIVLTLRPIKNQMLTDFWKNMFQTCFNLVITIPMAKYGLSHVRSSARAVQCD